MKGFFKGSTPYVRGNLSGKVVLDENGKDEFLIDTGFDLDVALPDISEVGGEQVGMVAVRTATGKTIVPVYILTFEIEGKSMYAVGIQLREQIKILGTSFLERAKALIDFEKKFIELK